MLYLSRLPATPRTEEILSIHSKRQKWVNQEKKGFLRYKLPCKQLAEFPAAHVDCSGDEIIIGHSGEVDNTRQRVICENLKKFMPWRKGPFSVFGIDIDAEWRSERKWNRVLPELPDMEGKIIADIGCNNGYYMFRISHHRPALVLGFEPSVQHYFCFKGLNGMAQRPELEIDLLGIEHLHLFERCFDIIFLMGIIYHRPSPIDTLRDIFTALQPGGTVIVESQAIPGKEPYALFPDKTYAKVPGTYFVPTGHCLCNWLQKAGFTDINLFCSHPMTEQEQRQTKWMNFESYTDFLHPDDPQKTVEGYPAPHRIFISAGKKGERYT